MILSAFPSKKKKSYISGYATTVIQVSFYIQEDSASKIANFSRKKETKKTWKERPIFLS